VRGFEELGFTQIYIINFKARNGSMTATDRHASVSPEIKIVAALETIRVKSPGLHVPCGTMHHPS